MSRLIDADDIRQKIERFFIDGVEFRHGKIMSAGGIRKYKNAVLEMIDKQPTVDPVVHAEWVIDEEGIDRCSACGKDKYEKLDADLWSDWEIPNCPHCGARMDKGEENE